MEARENFDVTQPIESTPLIWCEEGTMRVPSLRVVARSSPRVFLCRLLTLLQRPVLNPLWHCNCELREKAIFRTIRVARSVRLVPESCRAGMSQSCKALVVRLQTWYPTESVTISFLRRLYQVARAIEVSVTSTQKQLSGILRWMLFLLHDSFEACFEQ